VPVQRPDRLNDLESKGEREACSPDLTSLPLEQLEREIGELGAHIHAATCRWLLLVGEFDRREGWLYWGCRSCADWLSLRCGIALGSAREQTRVARRLAELPLVREAFAEGRLSYSKVRAISRVATPESEPELLELGLQATAAQLERIVRAYRGAASADLGQVNAAHHERYLSWSWEDDGSLVIQGRLPAEDSALLLRALEAARNDLRPSRVKEDSDADASAETSPSETVAESRAGATNADALAYIAEAALASGDAARSGGERYELVVHADASALAGDDAEGHCEIEHGPAMSPETARRIACDAALVRITEQDGRPLSVGRRTRTIPPAMRRALRSRDRCCRFPGCTQRRFVDAHHIRHWAHGGETKLSNLMLLCRRHHRLLHEGGYRLEPLANGGVRFRRPDGRPIEQRRACVATGRHMLRERSRRAGLAIAPETAAALSAGSRFSLDMAVEGLLGRNGLLVVGPVGELPGRDLRDGSG
jgi:Domain of unknown function (DUF222)/HNH endonuclease